MAVCALGRTDEGRRPGQSLVVNLGLSGGEFWGPRIPEHVQRGEETPGGCPFGPVHALPHGQGCGQSRAL